LLCLSNGNADGLGRTREKELETACRRLGFHEPPIIIDSPDLQDSMTTEWNPDMVADEIKRYLRSKAGESEITTIVTFDEWGVSEHPNHKAVHLGAMKVQESEDYPVDILTLTSVNRCRKYMAYGDIVQLDPFEWHFITFDFGYVLRAMACHASQFVWYRKLSILFSRYSWVCSFKYLEHPRSRRTRVQKEEAKKVSEEELKARSLS
jgi:N-acetylglucosaminylphosphatidylinositol deacetylase